VAEHGERGDEADRDQCGDEAVLDGGGAILALHKLRQHRHSETSLTTDRIAARSVARLRQAWGSRVTAAGAPISGQHVPGLAASPATSGRRKVASEDESFRKNGTR